MIGDKVVNDLRQSRAHEMMNGSKPHCPSGDERTSVAMPTRSAQCTSPLSQPTPPGRYLLSAHRDAQLYSISNCPNRRGLRRFCGARLCEPQHVESDRRVGFTNTLGARQRSCGSQTRAPLVAASPRWAVSQSCTLPNVGEPRRVGPIRRSADYKSATRQIEICATVNTYPARRRQHLGASP